MLNRLLLIAVLIVPHFAHASARLILDYQNRTATLTATMNYFGTLREEVLKGATEIIAKQWSGLPTRVGDTTEVHPDFWINGYHLKIQSDIKMNLIPTLAEARAMAHANQDLTQNFVRVEQGSVNAISATAALGANIYKFFYQNDLDHSTTAAHEFGHGIGIGHIMHFTEGLPPLMMERGSRMCEQQYFWNPKDPMSTINPYLRRVTMADSIELMNALDGLTTQTTSDGKVYIDIGRNLAAREESIFKRRVQE